MNRKLSLDELKRDSIPQYKNKTKNPVIVILDNIRSLNNIGAFFRTSDAFNVKELILAGITATPPHRDIQKTALGATQSVSWQHFQDTADAIEYARGAGYYICAVEQATEVTALQNFEVKKRPIALVFGNEVSGIQQSIIDCCDEVIEIPQFGTKHSFNVAVSAGIVLWEITKQNLT